ncbi:ABC transporter ATP-binding protein [Brooklawnia cerclae]|uniref:Peptide/nickel transport system ATP-binding protein n=1 Tax=Brooklawnia cerclae TaxID=349934 RepID=A0ABX0SM52_9ACTN|nr:ABC transporter ATP-binding protein [Brooklawnia cerclae]NIH57836.1 peptide/nickel transport system ATP-binding protein [Brooklawnia cerclae]
MAEFTDKAAPTAARDAEPEPLLRVEGLDVEYSIAGGRRHVTAVQDASFTVHEGEVVAIVGESGSGKTTVAHTIINLLAPNARVARGAVRFDGSDLADLTPEEWEGVRGRFISLIPQDPTVSLDPLQTVGKQVAEVLRIHRIADRVAAHEQAVKLLAAAGVEPAESRARQYPHEFSGGMRQRVLIAAALAANPKLVIADEPTSALDVTVQRQILDDIAERTRALGTAVLLITHDLGVAADRADRILVMQRGNIVERGTARQVLTSPRHPYTKGLIAAAPSLGAVPEIVSAASAIVTGARTGRPGPAANTHAERVVAVRAAIDASKTGLDPANGAPGTPLLSVRDLVKEFPIPAGQVAGHGQGRRRRFRAVDGVGFELHRGETLALVGESGSGKSTTARLALRLEKPDSGAIVFDGTDITGLHDRALKPLRRRFQLVYQSPYASLNPRFTLEEIVAEPLRAFRVGNRSERRDRAAELLERVGLPGSLSHRRPAELSGGQRQRVAIARALALSPDVVVLDEAVSALDVSVQSQILELLAEIQRAYGLAYLFISHDLAVVERISDRVLVLKSGRIVETGATLDVLRHPQEEYTKELVDAIPGKRVSEWLTV